MLINILRWKWNSSEPSMLTPFDHELYYSDYSSSLLEYFSWMNCFHWQMPLKPHDVSQRAPVYFSHRIIHTNFTSYITSHIHSIPRKQFGAHGISIVKTGEDSDYDSVDRIWCGRYAWTIKNISFRAVKHKVIDHCKTITSKNFVRRRNSSKGYFFHPHLILIRFLYGVMHTDGSISWKPEIE